MSLRTFLLFIVILAHSPLLYAQSKIFLDVGEARVRKSLLALTPFQYLGAGKTAANEKAGAELFSVISNNLAATGLFTNVDAAAYLEDPLTVGLRPSGVLPNGFDFAKWKTIGTEFLIRGGYQVINKKMTLEIYAYYVPQGNLVLGKKYDTEISSVRKLGHSFANDFIKAVTGKESFFNHQVVVGIDRGAQTNRDIYTADWDGQNAKPVTDHKTITVSPAWSRNGEHIAYTAFVKRKIGKGPATRNADMFIYETKSKRRWLVSYRPGMNSGAEFLPDGKNLLLTLSKDKTADIFKMSLDGKTISPITRGPGLAMNVEPAVSPDGSKIAFSSDRSGRPMIYLMNISGGDVKRITFAGHYNSTPSWTPDGKKIAFAGFDREKGNFDIFVVGTDGTGLLRLTSARKTNGKWANNEDPAVSPDGRHVLFISDRTGTKQLYLVNIDGTNERRITYDNLYYSKPKWGPAQN